MRARLLSLQSTSPTPEGLGQHPERVCDRYFAEPETDTQQSKLLGIQHGRCPSAVVRWPTGKVSAAVDPPPAVVMAPIRKCQVAGSVNAPFRVRRRPV